MDKVKRIIKRLLNIITKPEMKILPGNIAFFLMLSIIPIVTLIGVISGSLSVSTESLSNFMNQYFLNK